MSYGYANLRSELPQPLKFLGIFGTSSLVAAGATETLAIVTSLLDHDFTVPTLARTVT